MAGQNLSSIKRNKTKNPPGYKRIFFADIDLISGIGAETDHIVSDPFTLDPTTGVFSEIEFDTEGGAFLSIDYPEADGTTGYNYVVTVWCAGNDNLQKKAIDELDGKYLAIIGQTKDGINEILFEVGRGIRLKPAKESGARAGTRNGFLLTGNMDFNHLPYEFSGTIPLAT